MITQKVCHVTPNQPFVKQAKDSSDKSYENVIQRTFKLNAVERRIKSASLRPKQKYATKMPVTSNMEYGWEGEYGTHLLKTEASHKPRRST